jgi:biopolymer transport protein ExbD
MMRRNRNRRDDLPLTADINVTSLVDVAFTLLVIFIITAPVLQGGIEVDVPEADVDPVTAEDEPFYVSITPEGTVYVEESPLSVEEFRSSFPQLMRASDVQRVYVRADSLTRWATVLQVSGVLTEAAREGDFNFVWVGEPWPGG